MARVIPIAPDACAATSPGAGPRLTVLPPLSLYVHFPWCVRKCPYCDFNSHEVRGALPEDDYVEALIADLEAALPQVWGRPVGTVFLGGGTPSLLSAAAVDRLLGAIRSRLRVIPGAEITLEANPGTFEAGRFAGYRDAGINRLSLGVQSFDDRLLAAIGRVHDSAQAHAAAIEALGCFERVNLDLMVGLPGESMEQVRRDVDTAIGLGVAHVSVYTLTLEPNTAFHHRPPPMPDDEAAADMQQAAEEILEGAGFEHYEISAFARPGNRCAHNLNYWRFGDYLGIGAGAHGKLSFHDRIVRETRPRHPDAYLAAERGPGFVASRTEVGGRDLPFEFMMNALRLPEGFTPRLFEERTGLALSSILPRLEAAEREGLLEFAPQCIRASPLGLRFLNSLLQRFLPD